MQPALTNLGSNLQDVFARIRLTALRLVNKPTSSSKSDASSEAPFLVTGWRWHHLGISRDLQRARTQLLRRGPSLCKASPLERQTVLSALDHIFESNWDIHDATETRLLLPWATTRGDRRISSVAALISREAARLRKRRSALRTHTVRWASEDYGNGVKNQANIGRCIRETEVLAREFEALRRAANTLFTAAEETFIPLIRTKFSVREQKKFNDRVLASLSSRETRVVLVVFFDALFGTKPSVAKPQDVRDFETSVPAPLRGIAVPLWRRRLIGERANFLLEN